MSNKIPFTTIDSKVVKKDCPKVYKSIINWLERTAPEGNLVTEEMIHILLLTNPRFLYDYLDDMGIYIVPSPVDIKEVGRKAVEEQLFYDMLKKQEAKL
jgi:hypothetical protein